MMPNTNQHPSALWYIASSQAFFCFSFVCLTSLLTLYLIYTLGYTKHEAYELFATMYSLLFTMPLLGGYIAKKAGYIPTILIGLLIACIGFVILCKPGGDTIYLGLAFFISGHALFTQNMAALLGLHYSANLNLRSSGYTIYFLTFNIGALLSPIILGFVSLIDYKYVFISSAVSIFVSFLIFICYLSKNKSTSSAFIYTNNWPMSKRVCFISISTICLIFGIEKLIENASVDRNLLYVVTLLVVFALMISAKQYSKEIKLKIYAFLALCLLSVVFWSLYVLEPSLLSIFIKENVNRSMWGIMVPASAYYSFDPLFVIALGLLFNWLWQYCAKNNINILLPTKFALSIISIGLAYLILALGIHYIEPSSSLLSSTWIAITYAFIATGELLIFPIGLAMTGLLVPKGKEGLYLGVWQLFIGLSSVISGKLANFIDIPQNASPNVTNPLYLSSFMTMGSIAIAIGCAILLLKPLFKKLFNLNY